MLRKLCFLFFILILIPNLVHARGYKRFAMYTQYSSYVDILNDSSNPARSIPGDVSLNLDIRLKRVFIAILHGGQSINGDRSYWGLGVRIDLPGFFMMGGNVQEFIRKKKRRGLNTSLYWKNYVISEVNQQANLVGNRFGFSADIFLGKSAYLNIDLGLYSDNGNQHFSPSLGMGYEF